MSDYKYLSVLAIFKNEAMNLDVWMKHYIWMGVEHFYMIDNGSDDNYMEILQKYIDQGIVTLHVRPERYQIMPHTRFVYDAERIWEKSKWLLIVDLDEFWYCHNSTIAAELKSLEQYDVIITRWRMFGTSGCVDHPEDIRVSNVHREPVHPTGTKYLFKTEAVKSPQIEIHWISDNNNTYTDVEKFRLNHYSIQSLEYFKRVKMTRGDAENQNNNNVRDMNYFYRYDRAPTILDEDLKFMIWDQGIYAP